MADVSDEEGEEMKTEIVEGWPQGHEIRILISETDASQVNAIRRALIADVPKLAITRVDFSQGVTQDNKGEVVESVNVLPDEVLAHRLAMIPIPTNLDEGLVFPDACQNCMDVVEKDKGCPMCQVLYTLSARGPASDADEEFKTVYAGDITTISDPVFDIRDEHKQIPLTVLAKGQFSNSTPSLCWVEVGTTPSGPPSLRWASALNTWLCSTSQRKPACSSILV